MDRSPSPWNKPSRRPLRTDNRRAGRSRGSGEALRGAIRAGLNEVQLQAATRRLTSAGHMTSRRSENEQLRKHAGRIRGVGRGSHGVLWGLRLDPRLPNSFDPDDLGLLAWGAWGCSYFKAQDEY